MANIKSAQKRARQTTRRTARNKSVLTSMRSSIKAARASKLGASTGAKASKTSQAVDVVKEAVSKIMRAAAKGTLHKKTAARYVSRLTRKPAAKVQAKA